MDYDEYGRYAVEDLLEELKENLKQTKDEEERKLLEIGMEVLEYDLLRT